MLKILKRKTIRRKILKGTQGVISIFLALLMVPFTTIAGSLVNAARVNSAVAIFDEALCNASNSTLGTYDQFLKKRFGLLAMQQDLSSKGIALNQYTVSDFMSETFNFYLQQNLGVLSNTFISSESKSEGVYPLADNNVLLYQILEYSKYSVPVKLVEDALSIEDIVKSLENCIPGKGIFDIITSGTGVADGIMTLAEDFDLLKIAINDQKIATTAYTTTYNDFSGAISSYISKKTERDRKLVEIQTKIDEARSSVEGLATQIEDLEQQIFDLEEDEKENKTDNTEEIKKLKDELAELNNQNKDKLKEFNDAKTAYTTTENSYNSELTTLKEKISTSRTAYSGAISELSSKLVEVHGKLNTVQKDIIDLSTSVTDVATITVTTSIEFESEKNNKKIDELKKDIAKSTDAKTKENLSNQLVELEKDNVGLDNQKTVAEAGQKGFEAGMQSMKEDILSINLNIYNDMVQRLGIIKGNVDSYDVYNIKSISKSNYYIEPDNRFLTYEEAEAAENELVGTIAKDAVWSLIKTLLGFIEALFSVSVLYNPDLAAVIDSSYYNDTYGGLPSEKDRSVYKLNYGDVSDAALSQQYKEIFGDFSSSDVNALGDMDVISILMSIITDIGVITSNVTAIIGIVGLFNFAERFKKITDAATRIVENVKSMVNYLANVIAGSSVGSKVLLSGYVSYMTSSRTTYTGKALNGVSFNLRNQQSNTPLNIGPIGNFTALISTITSAVTGGTEKCFVGAETEYIMFGSKSEVVNQVGCFAVIYIVRVLSNILPIMTDPEVASIAAATTIASPIVYLIYILIEPLVDAIILVNGGDIPIYKTFIYLTPTGLSTLISKFSSLKLTTEQMDSAKVDFLDALGASDYADAQGAFGTSTNSKETKIFNMSYNQTLFLIMSIFTSREKMLNRLSDIIQMESIENMNNNNVGTNGLFDLDYSYTYIRTEASFSMNEFIKLSDKELKGKKRIIYRGY